jgi:hypothetical protein
MRIAPRFLLTSKAAVGIICLAVLCYGAWPQKRQLLELIGFDPGSILFGFGVALAALTVIDSRSHTIAGIATKQPAQTAAVRDWISSLVLMTPLAIFLPLVLLNALLLLFALGLVRANEVMGKPDQSVVPTTTVLVSGTPVARIRLGQIRYIQRESGSAFIYPVPRIIPLVVRMDSMDSPTYSRTILRENGRPTGPSHTPHDMIRKVGRGTYSHWGAGSTKPSYIYFSATDNTSPLVNGRIYSVEYVMGLHPALAFLIIVASLPLYMRIYIRLSGVSRKLPISPTQRSSPLFACGILCTGLGFSMLPLFAYWKTGKTTSSVIAGLLPWSDASYWLYGTYYLLNEDSLLWWTARRPISPAFMSFLAFITGENLQTMLAVRTVLTGIASLLLAAEIWRRYGTAAGITTFALLLQFVSRFTPTMLTESLGLAFGATAFAMMWQAISNNNLWRFAGGLFLLTLAMSVRPGPVLVAPFLAVWAVLNIGNDRSTVLSQLLLISSPGVAAIMITLLWTYFYGTAEGVPGANYAYTFYGLAFGGKPWQQFFADYPEASQLAESVRIGLAYRAAFAEILRNPSGLLIGLWLFSKLYLGHLFIYIDVPSFRFVSQILAFSGVVIAWYRSRRSPHLSFLVWGAAGIAFSAPFLFWAEDAYRAFIPTAPFEAVIVSVGLVTLVDAARSLPGSEKDLKLSRPALEQSAVITMTTTAVAGFLVLGSTLAPAAALALHSRPNFSRATCDEDLKPSIIHLGKSSPFVEIVADQDNETFAPRIAFHDFRADPTFANVEIREALTKAFPGNLLIHAYDLSHVATAETHRQKPSERLSWMIVSGSQTLKAGEYYLVCGRVKQFPVGQENYAITFVESARKIIPTQD